MNNKLNNKLIKNVKLDYIYCFLKNFDLSSAIWVLYLAYKGMSLWQIGILEGIFHFTSLMSEIPTGALADLLGRKKSLIIGRLCSGISSMLMLFSWSFWGFAVAFVISAWGYNFNSGSEEALVYDSLKLSGNESKYLNVNSKLNVIIEISQAISTFLGGVLSEYSYAFCYMSAISIASISFLFAFLFKEPLVKENSRDKINIKNHFKMCIKILKENKKIRKILLYYPIVFSSYCVVFFYSQKYFSDFGLNKIQISTIMLLSGLVSCIGALSSHKLLEIFKKKTVYFSSLMLAVCIISMLWKNITLSVIAFIFAGYFNSLLYPIQSSSLNSLIPSEQRATIISVDSMLFSVFMIIFFPITGALADIIGLNSTFFALGIILMIAVHNLTVDTENI